MVVTKPGRNDKLSIKWAPLAMTFAESDGDIDSDWGKRVVVVVVVVGCAKRGGVGWTADMTGNGVIGKLTASLFRTLCLRRPKPRLEYNVIKLVNLYPMDFKRGSMIDCGFRLEPYGIGAGWAEGYIWLVVLRDWIVTKPNIALNNRRFSALTRST